MEVGGVVVLLDSVGSVLGQKWGGLVPLWLLVRKWANLGWEE